ncbi:helix-turn-helix domain-containing protein [Crocosphaera chwakensis]|uniref:Transcriptional regulator n=1 Tax=Crocosphaera chwakensis CCY0110 TaxID=391612 RepID=A3IZ65_9CHRO|nr:helix-turn-helix transcriptional regulator [Crocosphaera chwakensis]EAZ88235.1 transcriptional regulator [Crocosphaera chwakensis CCY0110]
MTVKIQLKQLRTDRKLSQNKLAQLMEMSLQNIQRIEYGEAKSIPLDTLDKLCEILECEPGDLLVRIPGGDVDAPSSLTSQEIKNIQSDKITSSENDSSDVTRSHQLRIVSISKIPNSA